MVHHNLTLGGLGAVFVQLNFSTDATSKRKKLLTFYGKLYSFHFLLSNSIFWVMELLDKKWKGYKFQ